MVCATENRIESKIVGGFVLFNVAGLVTAWRACRSRPLGIGDFRAWLACHELEARRCGMGDGRAPSYSYTELAKLLGISVKRARASVRRLEAAGLIEWSGSAIGFPIPPGPPEGLEDTIGRGQGSVVIPRRMLRFLVAGARPALIATVIGMLLRCLSRRKEGWDGRGRVKASWIARVFGVDIRRVKAARNELVALGWIDPEAADQWAMNRWGRAYRIDLAWEMDTAGGQSLPPLPAGGRPATATPSVNQEPLPEREENQEPAGGPSGFSIQSSGNKEKKTLPSPKLDDVRIEDLKDTGRLLDLLNQAVAKGLVGTAEADRLRFVSAAEHALAIAQNPTALFAWIVLNGCWRYSTQEDEDRARRRLKLHDFGPPRVSAQPIPPSFSSSRPSGAPSFQMRVLSPSSSPLGAPSGLMTGLSEDARIVREVRAAMIRAGIFRDPWIAFESRNPGWSRGRWDAALAELGLC